MKQNNNNKLKISNRITKNELYISKEDLYQIKLELDRGFPYNKEMRYEQLWKRLSSKNKKTFIILEGEIMKQDCQYCGKIFNIKDLGKHEKECGKDIFEDLK